MIDPLEQLSIRRQCQLLQVTRGSVYYKPIGEKPENLAMMRLMDEHILEEPTAGVLTMQSMLAYNGFTAGYERVRRLMRKAAIMPIYLSASLLLIQNYFLGGSFVGSFQGNNENPSFQIFLF
jgi:putative transposase